jgi:hypothetical protein
VHVASASSSELPFVALVSPPAGCVRFAEWQLTILADSVLPAPDSPEMRIACRCSSIIMLENACACRNIALFVQFPCTVSSPVSRRGASAAHSTGALERTKWDRAVDPGSHLLCDGVHVWRQLPEDLAAVLRPHAAAVQVAEALVGVHLPSQHSASLHMAGPTAASASVSRCCRPSRDFSRPREAQRLLATAGGCCVTEHSLAAACPGSRTCFPGSKTYVAVGSWDAGSRSHRDEDVGAVGVDHVQAEPHAQRLQDTAGHTRETPAR